MLGVIIFSVGDFVLSVNEEIDLGSFIGYFESTRNGMGGPCAGLIVECIMIDSEIFVKNLNKSPPLSSTAQI